MLRARPLVLLVAVPLVAACAGDNFQPESGPKGGGAGASGFGVGGLAGSGGAQAGASAGGAAGASSGVAGAAGIAGVGGSLGGSAGAGGSASGASGTGGTSAGSGGAEAGGKGGASGGSAGAGGTSAGMGGTGGNAGNAGGAGKAGGAGDGGHGGEPTEGCTTLFVAPPPIGAQGSDRGCDPSKPLATIVSAIARARPSSVQQTVTRIHVCSGSYLEPSTLILDVPVSIAGSFQCANGAFVPPNADGATSQVMGGTMPLLTITGPSIGPGVEISDLAFVGGAVPNGTAPTVVIEAKAKPTLTANQIFGGVGTDHTVGSTAVLVRDGAEATFVRGDYRGGEGTLSQASGKPVEPSGVASSGLYIARDAGPVIATGTTFEGGRGTAPGNAVGSAGIAMRGGKLQLRACTVGGGEGVLEAQAPPLEQRAFRSVGLDIGGRGSTDDPSVVKVSKSVLRGGNATGTEASRTAGVRARRSILTLDHDRLYGGDANKSSHAPPIFGQSVGLMGEDSTLTVSNSVVHGGGAIPTTTTHTGYTRAMYLEGSSLKAHFVTFLAGASSTGNAVGLQLAGRENFFEVHASSFVAQTTATFGIFGEGACPQGEGGEKTPISNQPTLDPIVFVQPETGPAGRLYQGDGSCGTTDDVFALGAEGFDTDTVRQIVATLPPPSPTPDGLLLVGACTSNATCPALVFDKYSKTDAGLGPTLQGAGLAPLCGSAPEHLLMGATRSSDFLDDLADKPRAEATAHGALERTCL